MNALNMFSLCASPRASMVLLFATFSQCPRSQPRLPDRDDFSPVSYKGEKGNVRGPRQATHRTRTNGPRQGGTREEVVGKLSDTSTADLPGPSMYGGWVGGW